MDAYMDLGLRPGPMQASVSAKYAQGPMSASAFFGCYRPMFCMMPRSSCFIGSVSGSLEEGSPAQSQR